METIELNNSNNLINPEPAEFTLDTEKKYAIRSSENEGINENENLKNKEKEINMNINNINEENDKNNSNGKLIGRKRKHDLGIIDTSPLDKKTSNSGKYF